MPRAPLRATATALPDDALIARLAVVLIDAATAVGRAVTLAAVLDERLAKERRHGRDSHEHFRR